MDREVISASAEMTAKLGEDFAKKNIRSGSVIALRGELGAGKTQFAKGIARALGLHEEEISSPTYALVNEYDVTTSAIEKLYHLDCYRFEKPEELIELGIEEYLYPKHAITIIEWPERIEKYLPPGRIELVFEILSPNERKIIFQ